jgi:DNA-binding response OmpR family regulator
MASRKRTTFEPRVLVAADADAFRKLLAHAADMEFVQAPPEEAAERALELRPSVVAWLGADVAEGLRVMLALRNARSEALMLYLTPRSAEAERLVALEAGVDEVLSEPISRSELAGRIRLLLRRAQHSRRLPVGRNVELDLDRRELLRDGGWVHLRPKEARLLELFARAPGRVLSRAFILERVWGPDHEGDPRTVDVHVRWLRSKIEPDPHEPVRLLTVRGVGYRLEPAPLTKR